MWKYPTIPPQALGPVMTTGRDPRPRALSKAELALVLPKDSLPEATLTPSAQNSSLLCSMISAHRRCWLRRWDANTEQHPADGRRQSRHGGSREEGPFTQTFIHLAIEISVSKPLAFAQLASIKFSLLELLKCASQCYSK